MQNNNTTAFVGLGLAGVRAFSTFADGLYQDHQRNPETFAARYQDNPLKVMLIDKKCEIGGLAYNRNTSPVPLLVHNSTETLSPVGEFQAWMAENKDRIITFLREFGDAHAEAWLDQHATDLRAMSDELTVDTLREALSEEYADGPLTPDEAAAIFAEYKAEWRVMHIPRAVYGLFLEDEIGTAIAQLDTLQAAGVEFEAWQGEVDPASIDGESGSGEVQFAFRDDNATPMEWRRVGGEGEPDHVADGELITSSASHYALKPKAEPGPMQKHVVGQLGYFLGIPTAKDWAPFQEQQWHSYMANMYQHQPENPEGEPFYTEQGRNITSFAWLSALIERQSWFKGADEKVEVVVLGNKASGADMWVWAMSDPWLRELVMQDRLRFTHISGGGEAEVRHATSHKNPDYDRSRFIARMDEVTTAEGLLDAYVSEIAAGSAIMDNDEVRHSYYDIVKAINPVIKAKLGQKTDVEELVTPLDETELEFWHHGTRKDWKNTPTVQYQIMNFLTAPETIEARDQLRGHGGVADIAGRFIGEDAKYEGGQWTVPLESGEIVTGDIVVNAAGYGPNSKERANLFPLYESGIVTFNEQGTGFAMNPETLRLISDADLGLDLNLYSYGITARGSIIPGDPYGQTGTAAGNQSQLDMGVQAIISKMLENVNVHGIDSRSFTARAGSDGDTLVELLR